LAAANIRNNSRQSPCIVNPPDLIDLRDCGYGDVDRHRCVVANYWGLVTGCFSVVCIKKHASCNLNTFLCLLEQAVAQLPLPTVLAMVTKQTLTTNFINWMPIVGVILNHVGSILLAFSLNKTTKMLSTSITALEHLKDTLLSKGDIVSFTGMDIHRNKAVKNSKILTLIGLLLLVLGFTLQLLPLQFPPGREKIIW
jgi:hypothetical protein